MTTLLNTSFQMQFRVIDGLTVRFARSQDGGDHALLAGPWPNLLRVAGLADDRRSFP